MTAGVFAQKTVLVTGGTGSFGRAFCRRILDHDDPAKVIVYSRDEAKQFEMAEAFPDPRMRFFIGDVRDRDRLHQAMNGVDLVVHAAAMKQVPIAEYNPHEAVKTNIGGAENVIAVAIARNVEKVIGLSTDKAVDPVNLYGATKLAADRMFIGANNLVGKGRTRFAIVRYGNVAGSRGSVLEVFWRLVARGADHLPITDSRMTRFWITLEQGVDFVRSAFARMSGGETLIPRLASVRITDVAAAVAPHLPTREIGIRPGEKIHEMMCSRSFAHLTYDFGDHLVIRPNILFVPTTRDPTRHPTGETGALVPEEFEYCSNTNGCFLTVEEIKALSAGLIVAS